MSACISMVVQGERGSIMVNVLVVVEEDEGGGLQVVEVVGTGGLE